VREPRQLVVSVHDVAPPHWQQVQRLLDRLAGIGVPHRSLLVIPNYHGRWPIDRDHDFCAWLRQQQAEGDEIVLHGYEHLAVGTPTTVLDRWKNRWYTQGEGEFLALTYGQACERIHRGLEMMTRAKVDVHGFVAPSWLVNPEGLRAARDSGLQYTNSYLTVVDLPTGRSRFIPSLVFGPGHLNEDLGVRLQQGVSRVLSYRRVVRIVLHPPCLDDPARFQQIVTMIAAQRRDRSPVTYLTLLSSLRVPGGTDDHATQH
jgi:predicted deacetylase